MAGPNVRLVEPLKSEAAEFAASIGVSLNALVAVALRDYLDARSPSSRPPLPRSLPHVSTDQAREPPAPEARPASAPAPPSGVKVGRNDPCPCGSGRKAKHCHPESC